MLKYFVQTLNNVKNVLFGVSFILFPDKDRHMVGFGVLDWHCDRFM